jgi:hypothetical protein
VGHGLDRAVSEERQLVGTCEYSNEHSGSIKFEKFLD